MNCITIGQRSDRVFMYDVLLSVLYIVDVERITRTNRWPINEFPIPQKKNHARHNSARSTACALINTFPDRLQKGSYLRPRHHQRGGGLRNGNSLFNTASSKSNTACGRRVRISKTKIVGPLCRVRVVLVVVPGEASASASSCLSFVSSTCSHPYHIHHSISSR